MLWGKCGLCYEFWGREIVIFPYGQPRWCVHGFN